MMKLVKRAMNLAFILFMFFGMTAADFCKNHPDKNTGICEKQDGATVSCIDKPDGTPNLDCYGDGWEGEDPGGIG
jgi:hypothetical protein